MEHVDVLIVGAGLSGIGAAYHLKKRSSDRSFVVFEGRENIGGTWDLFRYPGIRSDSDMFTLGYAFKPWTEGKAIADGPSILKYINETASENNIPERIRFRHWVKRATWDEDHWLVEAETDEGTVNISCNFLLMCSGYYNYEHGYTPEFEGRERFHGPIIHPQQWPEDLDYANKKVLVIGSGATAMTIVPEMSHTASHVTMLQRSPTYVVSMPSENRFANWLRQYSENLSYFISRWKSVILGWLLFTYSRKRPEKIKNWLVGMVRRELGSDFDIEKHFTPNYNPWDQRICLVPDADLFEAIRGGKVAVVTDHIETFTASGVMLKSGKQLDADLIVTATGLDIKVAGGIDLIVDSQSVDVSEVMTYKGMMLEDVPNAAIVMGYTNASYTLKADLTSTFVCRLLNYMRRHDYTACCPRNHEETIEREPIINFTSGYIQRAIHKLPKQGSRSPWRLYQNYFLDLVTLGYGSIADSTMEFSSSKPQDEPSPPKVGG